MIPTAQCRLATKHGLSDTIRVLCDTGAQTNLITKNCVQRLKLPSEPTTMVVAGVDGTPLMIGHGKVNAILHSRDRSRALSEEMSFFGDRRHDAQVTNNSTKQ